jgi:hypothetical protein
MELNLSVNDPEVVAYLTKNNSLDMLQRARLALRIGVLALSNAEGAMDVEAMRNEGAHVIGEVRAVLTAHATQVATTTSQELARYLDPSTGALEASIAKLRAGSIAHIDLLNGAVMAHVGESGTVAKTLLRYIGEGSPLLRMLDPGQESGLRARIEKLLQDGIQAQRTAVLSEFSLDRPDSALSRLLREVSESNTQLTTELSLDKNDSALSRLVQRVDAAAAKSVAELTLDNEASALTRLRLTLEGRITELGRSQQDFQTSVLEMLVRFDEKKRVGATGTQHGQVFEFALLTQLEAMAENAGELFDATGNTTGLVRNCKVGDAVITIGPDRLGAGQKIVYEAKEDQSYGDTKALAEIDVGMKNRDARVGVFVFSKRTAPEGMKPLRRIGDCVLVVWDQDDDRSLVYLEAAHALATALIAKAAREKDAVDFDFSKVDTEIAEIEKMVERVANIGKKCETIRSAANSIEEEVRITSEKIGGSVRRLRTQVASLKDELA